MCCVSFGVLLTDMIWLPIMQQDGRKLTVLSMVQVVDNALQHALRSRKTEMIWIDLEGQIVSAQLDVEDALAKFR